MPNNQILQVTKNWINRFVIDLNLCPFAKAEIKRQTVRFQVSSANTAEQLLQHLQFELNYLNQHTETETTLLIHPNALNDFHLYNEFLELCDNLLEDMQLDGTYQIASFHPQYQFADTLIEDVENYSNRSPFPMLHLLRETSLEKALLNFPDADSIPIKNINTLNALGLKHCINLLKSCFKTTE